MKQATDNTFLHTRGLCECFDLGTAEDLPSCCKLVLHRSSPILVPCGIAKMGCPNSRRVLGCSVDLVSPLSIPT